MEVGLGLAKQEDAEGSWSLPDGWLWVELRDIGNWTSGGTPKSNEPNYYDGPIPWFRITELNEGRLRKAEKTLTERGLNESSAKVIPAPFLMFAMYGASIGKMAISEIDAATNQAIACCVPSRVVDIDYLFWALQRLKRSIIALGQGGAQPNISQRILLECRVPLAPLAEQRRIVARIDALFAEIAEGEAALAEARKGLDIFRRALLKAAVMGELTKDWRAANPASETGRDILARISDERASKGATNGRSRRVRDFSPLDIAALPELPEGWAWATLGDLGEIVGGATVDKKRKPSEPVTIPYLRVANVQRGHVDLAEVKTITVERTSAEKLRLLAGDLLLNEGGDRDKIGRGWVWDGSIPNMIHQNHVFRVRLYEDSLNSFFVSHYANEMGRRFFIEEGKQTTNLASISLSKISMLPVPVPPPAESAEIIRRVAEALAAADDTLTMLDTEAADAARLKQSILKAAFEGRLLPQDPTDEPASALLARLAADRSDVSGKRGRAKSAR